MIGLAEAALFLAPFAIFLAWRFLAPRLPKTALIAAIAALLLTGLAAAWTMRAPAMHAGDRYVPAQLLGTLIEPGRAIPK
jgi:hypothetical protein